MSGDGRPTLGEVEAVGAVPPTGEFDYDLLFGPEWRSLTIDEAKEALNEANSRLRTSGQREERPDPPPVAAATGYLMPNAEKQQVAAPDDQDRIVAKMTEHVDGGEHISEALAKKVLRELYGERPPRAALDAMLAVMGHVERYPPAQG